MRAKGTGGSVAREPPAEACAVKTSAAMAPIRIELRKRARIIGGPSLEHERGAEIHAIDLRAGAVFPMLDITLEGDLLHRVIGGAGGRDGPPGGGITDESRRDLLVRVEIFMATEENERPSSFGAVSAQHVIGRLDVPALHRRPDRLADKGAHPVRAIQRDPRVVA